MSDLYWLAADVLILGTELAQSPDLPPPADLRQRVVALLDRFVAAGRAASVPDADIAEARYALVAFTDEQILKSNWPGRPEWMSQPLQLLFYREVVAGENFFARMQALLRQGRVVPLEVYYLCLALGFRGAYGAGANSGAFTGLMDEARRQLLQKLPSTSKISPNAHPRDRAKAVKVSKGPVIALFSGCALVILATLFGLHFSLKSNVDEAVQSMAVRTPPRH